MVSYLISFVIGDYRRIEDKYGDLSIGYWVTPEYSDEDAFRSFSRTPEMVAYFNELTGIPYPYEKLDQIIVDDFMWGGMENITLIHQSSRTMHTDRARPDHTSDGLVAHEIAHQWFGNMLTTRNWANAWLNEGFATFLTYVWQEYDKGRDDAEYSRRWMMSSVKWADKSNPRPMVQYYYVSDMDLFDSNIYAKGSLVLNMLRQILGYDAFWRAVRNYAKEYQHKNVESQDLKRIFEDVTGQNLEWFFDQWVYTAGLPELEIKYKYNRRNEHVKLTVKQTQKVENSSLFRLPLTVLIDNGEIIRQEIWIEEEESTFLIPSIRNPNMVLVDEGHIIPKRMKFDKKHPELMYQAKNAPHILDRIWAIEQLADHPHKKSIENTLVFSLKNDPFYGVRIAAATALGEYEPRKGGEILMNSIDRQDNRVKRACIRSLRNYKGAKIRNFLLNTIMNSDNDYLVNDAYNTMFRVDSMTADSLFDWAMKQDSHNDIIRKSAIRSLSKYNKTNYKRLKVLLKYGETPWSCRSTVLSTIGKHVKKHPELIEEFEELLFDPSRGVRTTAANLLSQYGDESHIPKLENLIIRDPITDRWITPLISRLKGEKDSEEKSYSIKNDLLDIRDRLDKLIKSQKE
jgi:aminopeptidase N